MGSGGGKLGSGVEMNGIPFMMFILEEWNRFAINRELICKVVCITHIFQQDIVSISSRSHRYLLSQLMELERLSLVRSGHCS